jgi:cytochrome c oxidase subunit 2
VAKHIVSVVVIWAMLRAAGEVLVWTPLFPAAGTTEAKDFDEIFRILLIMGIPVFAFVVSVLSYALIAFRSRSPDEHAAPMARGGVVPKVWLAVTASLAILVMVYPGLTGLAKLQSDAGGYGWGSTEAELLIKVEAFQWNWTFEYPEQGIELSGSGRRLSSLTRRGSSSRSPRPTWSIRSGSRRSG